MAVGLVVVLVNHQRGFQVLKIVKQCPQPYATHHSHHCITHNESSLWTHPFQLWKLGIICSSVMSFWVLANPGCSFVYSSYCTFPLGCSDDYETPSLFTAVLMETIIVL